MFFKKDKKEKDNELNNLNNNLERIATALEESNDLAKQNKVNMEIMLTYLSQIMISEQEINKNTAFANALKFLESQYNSSDKIMNIDEIQEYYTAIRNEIFIQYNEEYKKQIEDNNTEDDNV